MSSIAKHQNNYIDQDMYYMVADSFSAKGKAQRLEPVIADAYFAQKEGVNSPLNPQRQRIYTVERPPVKVLPLTTPIQTTTSQTAPSQTSSSRFLMHAILYAVALLALSILLLVL